MQQAEGRGGADVRPKVAHKQVSHDSLLVLKPLTLRSCVCSTSVCACRRLASGYHVGCWRVRAAAASDRWTAVTDHDHDHEYECSVHVMLCGVMIH